MNIFSTGATNTVGEVTTGAFGSGRIAGVSGIAARAVRLNPGGMPRGEALAFLVGLPLGAAIVSALAHQPRAEFASPALLIAAGLAVGLGTRLGSGCTSGHGVCGVSRLSGRSLVATAVFMMSGIATVALTNALGAGS